ncbi:MAG TPA: aryl-sulfate sulfotransferase [Verrucomicrobiae bacterium]|nr:aryl-sulfate sulfotransferase [Verrucomicrobiae bacterium]
MSIKTHWATAALLLSVASSAPAVTLLSAPSFTPSTNAPLAGLLRVTTDVDTRVSVSVADGITSWTRSFHDFGQDHSIILAGFKPNRTNQIQVTVIDRGQNAQVATPSLVFLTAPLPADFPAPVVVRNEPAKMEPGYTLFIIQNRSLKKSYITMLDNRGEVAWFCPTPALADVDVRQLPNGHLFLEEPNPINRFTEIDLLGQTVSRLAAPTNYPVNNHEAIQTARQSILYLSDVSQVVSNLPSSVTNAHAPLVTAAVDDNPIVEISATNGAVLNAWSPNDMLDPNRVTYLTYSFQSSFGVDTEHANAIVEDSSDNSLIVSLRNQNAVFKFLKSTGQLKWILGSPENWSSKCQPYLLKAVGSPFQWCYGQHAPELTPRGTLLLYDDGNCRANPFALPVDDRTNYSRAVEYSVDENKMQVSQVWDSSQKTGDRLYTGAVGDADWLPKTGNILVTYGLISYVNGVHPSAFATNATMARIIEMTHDAVPQEVFDVSFFDSSNTQPTYQGCLCYRSARISDLYPHPLTPVQDLVVSVATGGPILQFSGDSGFTYSVQASADQIHWQSVGNATAGSQPDSFQFQDSSASAMSARFYRVVAH